MKRSIKSSLAGGRFLRSRCALALILGTALAGFASGCNTKQTFSNIPAAATLPQTVGGPGSPGGPADPGTPPAPTTTTGGGPTVCDPFGGGTPPTSASSGLRGELRFIPMLGASGGEYAVGSVERLTGRLAQPVVLNGQTACTAQGGAGDLASIPVSTTSCRTLWNSDLYWQFGVPSTSSLFLSSLNVPTRQFTEGFATDSGSPLTNQAGERLIEYFAMRLSTQIRLGGVIATPGWYQFALLSDDGSVMRVTEEGVSSVLVNNDLTHAAQLRCSSRAISFDANTRLPAEITYFQGPRNEIAAILLWRRVSDNSANALADPDCNLGASADRYFQFRTAQGTPIVPSVPTAAYNALLARGWRPVDSANFEVPGSNGDPGVNPCNQ